MARRNASSQAEHDRVIEAWAQVVVRRFAGHVQVSTNPGSHRRAQVGSAHDSRFPDVLIGSSDRANGRDGTAELVPEVETSDSLQEDEVAQRVAHRRLPAPFTWSFRQVLSQKPSGWSRKRQSAFHNCGPTRS